MTQEEKAKQAAEMVRQAAKNPLLPGAARVALSCLADAFESMAHEIEILKIRLADKRGNDGSN